MTDTAPTAREAQAEARPAVWADADADRRHPRPRLPRRSADLLPAARRGEPAAEDAASSFSLLFKLGLPFGCCDVTTGYRGGRALAPARQVGDPVLRYLLNAGDFLGLFGFAGARQVTYVMDIIEKRHPHEPHYYLQAIGTDPVKQGKGYGGVVMRRQLAAADAAHMPAYLESSQGDQHPDLQELRLRGDRRDQAPERPDPVADVAPRADLMSSPGRGRHRRDAPDLKPPS